jgi:fructose-1,6-bisphosphatase/inositol monophosphatase family enzyme
MHDVASTVVIPRFRMLAAHEIAEKTPGEIVTSVDRAAEERLYDGLDALGLGARIVGEEAAAGNARLLKDIGSGQVWLIDPLDGTANFAAGREPFGLMVALIEDGIAVAGWLLDPVTGRMCHTERGAGAYCDGEPVRARGTGRNRAVAALATQFMGAELREHIHARAERRLELVPIPRCAAEHYPRLCFGQNDIALFQRTLPWDHAAGVLFLHEAGGCATRWDGTPYRVGDGKAGLLAASDERLWHLAAEILLGADMRLNELEYCTA